MRSAVSIVRLKRLTLELKRKVTIREAITMAKMERLPRSFFGVYCDSSRGALSAKKKAVRTKKVMT
jgi:hypothetical protein